jgi:glycosyltransferase involved in cell wall biosynthesis
MKRISKDPKRKTVVTYVPHGVTDMYKPLSEKEIDKEFRKQILGGKEYDFIIFWSNRNIRRKQAPDVIWAYKMFADKLPADKKSKVLLLMHTQPVDGNGTDLPEVIKRVCPDVDVKFSPNHLPTDRINQMMNFSDICVNICGNEGFGLTTAEATMSGLPTIVLITGGLQDQCGLRFKDTGKLIDHNDYIKYGTFNDWRAWEGKIEWGEWVQPVWARAQTIAGSLPTPYIVDDKLDIYELAEAMRYWYDLPKEERKQRGLKGREFFLSDAGYHSKRMCDEMVKSIEKVFENWQPRKRYELYKL